MFHAWAARRRRAAGRRGRSGSRPRARGRACSGSIARSRRGRTAGRRRSAAPSRRSTRRCPSAPRRRSRGCPRGATTRTCGLRAASASASARVASLDPSSTTITSWSRASAAPRRSASDRRGDVLRLVEARQHDREAREAGVAVMALRCSGTAASASPPSAAWAFRWRMVRVEPRGLRSSHGRADPGGGGRRRSARRDGRRADRRRPRVRSRRDGGAALDALAGRRRQLVLLDVALGAGIDGVEVCRRLRRLDDDVYVMMLTARDGEAEVVLALEAGADDYVTKPVGIAELRSRVRAALRRLGARHRRPARRTVCATQRLALDPAARRVRVDRDAARADALGVRDPRGPAARRRRGPHAGAAAAGDLRRRRLPRPARRRRARAPPAREARARPAATPAWVATVRGVGYRLGP